MSSAQNQVPQPGRSPSSAPSSSSSQNNSNSAASSADSSVDPTSPPMISPPSPSAERILSNLDATASQPAPTTAPASVPASAPLPSAPRQQPIPPASEPMQYRAIGLIQGRYEASPEQFTRGFLHTEDGTAIDAVLLGRVMSLVRKHIDLEQNHLWVVYPRTREKSENLHMQVVGVWEPEKLAPAEAETPEPEATSSDAGVNSQQDGYFSIRGEVLFYAAENQRLIVKIQQSPRAGSEEGKVFKLNLNGELPGNKSVGYFWDLHVERKENSLVVREANVIGLVPPKKRKAGDRSLERRRPMGGGQRRPPAGRPQRPDRPFSDRPTAVTPPVRREPISKPVKKPKTDSV